MTLSGAARRLVAPGSSPLRDRVVLVTGASSGIGEQTAYAAASRGATVLLVARRAEELAVVRDRVLGDGGRAAAYPCDLTDGAEVDALAGRVLDEHGAVHHLVNNAGRSIRRSLADSGDRFHDVERTMAINYFAPVRLTMALLPTMRDQGFGHVVNVLSWGVQIKAPRFSAYLASKSALDTWGRVLAREAHGDNVRVTNMRFGLVRTPMVAPTKAYDRLPMMSAQAAGRAVANVLEDRPASWSHPVGTLGEAANLVAAPVMDRVMHGLDRLPRR
ncbi:MAG: fatty acyl-CoA reductase [Nocardioides sp.]|nr:fatty acyl-CoA reductase [Nocardioides sp.]